MKKRLLCAFLALVLVLGSVPVHGHAAGGPRLGIDPIQGQPGDYLYFPIRAEELENLAALELTLFYDPQVLEFINCDSGWLLGGAMFSFHDSGDSLTITAVSAEGISGSGEIFYVYFMVRQDCPPGKYPLTLAPGEMYDTSLAPISVSAKSGMVTVTEYAPSHGQFYLEMGLSDNAIAPGETVTAWVRNAWWMSFASCDLTVHYDATMFRLVEAKVAQEMENTVYSLNTATPGLVRLTCATPQDIWCYDMLELTLEAREGALGTTPITAEIRDVCDSGRFPYHPGSAESAVTVIPKEVIRTPKLILTGEEPIVGETTTMTLTLEEGSGLAAADFELTFDPQLVECIDVQPAGDSQFLLISPNFSKGTIRFSLVEEAGIRSERPLVTITWQGRQGASSHYRFELSLIDPVGTDLKPIAVECPVYSGCVRIRETVDATCETPGGEQLRCAACGKITPLDPLPALGHSYGDPTFVWSEDFESCSAYRVCARDEGHVWQVNCTVTHESTGSSCTQPGSITYTATADFYGEIYTDTRTEYRDLLGHDYAWTVVTQPGCESQGSRRGTCTRCGATTTESMPALGHDHVAIVKAPGCTESGWTDHTCTRCGDSYRDSYTDSLGHDHEWFRMADPTCDSDGWDQGKCVRCGDMDTRNVPALGHDWNGTTCRNCGAVRENPFTDVPEGSFYYDPVIWAVASGVTTGATATTFNPGGECMRAHVVTFLWRAAGQPEPVTTINPFLDVKPTDFYYKAVLWAVENGVTNGVDATHFGPTVFCNRAQVVTFLYRAMGNPAVSATSCPFIDVQNGQWYEKPILWAVENGVTNGLSATTFGVNSICNRAQVVTFLYRTFA